MPIARISALTNSALGALRQHLAARDVLLTTSLMGIAAGALTALVIWLFRQAIDYPLATLLPGDFESLTGLQRLLLPFLGSLLIAGVLYLAGSKRQSMGLAHVINITNNQHGALPPGNAIMQFVCGVIAILTGQAGGREGPAVHLGAAINSWSASFFHLPNNSRRILISCGCAAAVSASFNTPIAGVIFAMEVVMLEYTIVGFTPVILSAITAALLSQATFGPEPMFTITTLGDQSVKSVALIATIGFICGSAAALFVGIQQVCFKFVRLPLSAKLALAGLITGIVGYYVPEVMGLGYDTLGNMLGAQYIPQLLLIIVGAKLLVTAIACGLGMPLGYIGPALIVGAGIGSFMGLAIVPLYPDLAQDYLLYVLLGMGAMMAALLNAPLAAIMAVIELTNNAAIILPAMVATICATLTSTGLYRQKSAVRAILESQGFKLLNDPLSQALQRTAVTNLMDKDYRQVAQTLAQSDAEQLLKKRPRWLITCNEEQQKYLLESTDLVMYMQELSDTTTESEDETDTPEECPRIDLLDIPGRRRKLVTVHPQATLREALETLNRARADALHITGPALPLYIPPMGVLTREDIENYYRYPQD
jgi:CIC family chloride channel protein